MNGNNRMTPRLWYGPAVMFVTFFAAFLVVTLILGNNIRKARLAETQSMTVSLGESIRRRLTGNESYLLMLANSRATGTLDAATLQERASVYVREHPELINITWVDTEYYIRDVAPLAANRQILGLHLDLPEPKRVSKVAEQERQPVYTRPFEAIQGNPSFEVWVPVYNGNTFLGLFAGVYSCNSLLRELVAPQLHGDYQARLVDASGRVIAQLSQSGTPDEKISDRAALTPVDSGVFLQLRPYGTSGAGRALQLLEFLCLALVLAMAYAMWGLKREVNARRQTEAELQEKKALLEEELSERLISQEALQEQTAVLEEEIEERTRIEQSLRESEARFRVLIEQAPEAIIVYDLDLDRLVDANSSATSLFGCSKAELLSSGPRRFYAAGQPDGERVSDSFARHNEQAMAGEPVQFERAIRSADGRDLVCMMHLAKLPSEGRRLIRATLVDVTERKRLEGDLHLQALRLEEQLAQRRDAQEALQEQTAQLKQEVEERRRVEEALVQSETTVRHKLQAILEPSGDIGKLELSDILDCEELQSMMNDFYQLTGMLGAVLDVSGKVLVAVGWQDICTKFHRCNPDTASNCTESDTVLTTGVPPGTFKMYRCKNNMWDMVTPIVVGGRHVGNVFIGQFFYKDEEPDREKFRSQARQYGFDEEEYLAALDRAPRFSREAVLAGMRFYSRLASLLSTMSFSSIKLSRMLAEQTRLEEQLRQSQKMEAVGQLAGGVAHDFNNLLQVISGYGELLKIDEKLDTVQSMRLDHMLSSAEKAAQLTHGLLAFSRKQVMTFAPVDLNDIVRKFKKMLVRIIGEDIQLRTLPCENELVVYADTGQVEQVLMNLATNARDAMPKGGILTLETGLREVEPPPNQEGHLKPGPHAVLTVSDTGCGMDEDTRQRIFEPFFTTKEVGKGTGLGMAIVYGIVKQHNGFLNVYSEVGQGTTFRVFLPIYEATQQAQTLAPSPLHLPVGGGETILLAEDDSDVREFVFTVLAQFGYQVIQAVDGQDAVEKFAAHREEIQLILMDMIMPKLSGMEAYRQIASLKPGVKVLYSSGYTADFMKNRGMSEEGIELIMKPVQPMELLRKVRQLLDQRSA